MNSPTLTSHALGELSAIEERLLRMSLAQTPPGENPADEIAEIQAAAAALSRALKAESPALSLTPEQREAILHRIAAPPQASASGPQIPRSGPPTMSQILREREEFNRKPARMATFLTLGAAAAVIVLLAVLRPGSSQTASARATNEESSTSGGETETGNFKVSPPKPAVQNVAEDARTEVNRGKLTAPPPLNLVAPPNRDPSTQRVVQQGDATLSTPGPKSPAPPTLPNSVKIPPQPGTDSSRTYASPPTPPRSR